MLYLHICPQTLFFEEMSISLCHIANEYDKYIIAGDLLIKMLDPKCDGDFIDLKDK